MVLGGREEVLLAIDGAAGGGEEDLAHAAVARRLGQVEAAEDVDVGIEDRVLDRAPHVHLRRVMDEDVHPRFAHQGGGLLGADVEHVQLGPWGDVLPPAAGKVVDHQHPVAPGQECVGQMGADEPGPARDADGLLSLDVLLDAIHGAGAYSKRRASQGLRVSPPRSAASPGRREAT